jgi:hypothetical protein
MLEKVRDSEHPLSEGHGTKEGKGHGVIGHKEGSKMNERKYKKSKKKKKVDYKKAYKKYHSSKKAKTERAMRNAAGRIMKKLGKKKAGYEVDHIVPISKGGTNDQDNLRMIPKSINRKLGQGITTSIRKEKDVYEGKKKKLSKKQLKIAQAAPPPDEITGADFAALRKQKKEKSLDEKSGPKPNKYQKTKYKARGKRGKSMAKTSKQYADAKKAGRKVPDSVWRERERFEKIEREKDDFKTRKRSDSMKESFKLTRAQLRRLIMETLEEEMLDSIPKEDDADTNEALSAKTKATLKKKAEKRGFTPGSVYKEYEKGLAAWGSSGSRKGMTQHQWAHARVNSATPSKPWAVVKKSKKKK